MQGWRHIPCLFEAWSSCHTRDLHCLEQSRCGRRYQNCSKFGTGPSATPELSAVKTAQPANPGISCNATEPIPSSLDQQPLRRHACAWRNLVMDARTLARIPLVGTSKDASGAVELGSAACRSAARLQQAERVAQQDLRTCLRSETGALRHSAVNAIAGGNRRTTPSPGTRVPRGPRSSLPDSRPLRPESVGDLENSRGRAALHGGRSGKRRAPKSGRSGQHSLDLGARAAPGAKQTHSDRLDDAEGGEKKRFARPWRRLRSAR